MIMSANKNTKKVLTCDDFLELSISELKYYLAMRGLSREGLKLDLAARALVAYEQQMPIRQDIEDLQKELKDTYSKLLVDHDIPDPKTIDAKEWVNDVSNWPRTDIGKVFAYIIRKKAFDTDYIGQYKARKAYSYFMSGFVHEIFSHNIGTRILVKAKVKNLKTS